MEALSESNRIAHEVYEAHLEEIKQRKGDIVVIDLARKKVLDVINKDEALTLIQTTASALHRQIYLLNINPDKPLVWAR
jgi:chorismate-pyruvate lyase